jgi:hypothetical protein
MALHKKSLFICGYNVTIVKRGNAILVRVDDYVYKGVKEIVKESRDLGMTKSECLYVILKMFFEVYLPTKDFGKIREPSSDQLPG